MSTLLNLKNHAKEADYKLKVRRRRRSEFRFLGGFFAFPFGYAGAGFTQIALRDGDSLHLAGGIALAAAAAAVFIAAICWKGDKKERALKSERDLAVNSYESALWSKAAFHGIDISSTITQRTSTLDDAYEITAYCNGVAADIVVREFEGDLVFMLNGRRLGKAGAANSAKRGLSNR